MALKQDGVHFHIYPQTGQSEIEGGVLDRVCISGIFLSYTRVKFFARLNERNHYNGVRS